MRFPGRETIFGLSSDDVLASWLEATAVEPAKPIAAADCVRNRRLSRVITILPARLAAARRAARERL